MRRTIITAIAALSAVACIWGCTSAVIGRRASASGRPMLWKHRDTGAKGNFVATVSSVGPGEHAYTGLFNDIDTACLECWTGMNDAGFAIMNTASYNLAPDTATLRDREGAVMTLALRRCRTVADFAAMLDTLPRPMGIQANFGVIDAEGGAAFFEADDHGYTPFYIGMHEGDPDAMVRTNFSVCGNDSTGKGYVRFQNACHLLGISDSLGNFRAAESERRYAPDDFLQASRSYYTARLGRVATPADTAVWGVDQMFIPRRSSRASLVIEGIGQNSTDTSMTMWALLGFPPEAPLTTYKLPLKQK